MTPRGRGGVAALALAGLLLTGCSGAAAPGPTPAPDSSPAPSATPGADPDAAACQRHATASESVRRVVGAINAGPVLPAGVALFLLAPRDAYATTGVRDGRLVAAMAEVTAAIDDLDAQGKAALPAGGNASQDKVQLHPARIVAALDAVQRLCVAR